jgi:elongation factor 1 alpha-like protein
LFYFFNFNSLCISTANSTQLPSAGSSLGAEKKKKTPVVSEEIPVERTALLVPGHFQLKHDKSSGASSSSQNDYVNQKLSSDISQLNVHKNNVNVTKPCLPEEYKPEKWMLADQESGALSQLNLAIVGHHSCPVVNTVSII